MAVSMFQTSGRAVMQIGGTIGVVAVGIASALIPPMIGPFTLGSAWIISHYFYDRSQWQSEEKIEYLREHCVAHIEIEFEKQREELRKKIQDIDEANCK